MTNSVPKGFGANHNHAFYHEMAEPDPAQFFGILNPDLNWSLDPFGSMLKALQSQQWAFVCPRQYSTDGRVQDHLRALPTPVALLKRYFFYRLSNSSAPDWVNAACMVFRSDAFAEIGGFDESFYMYCEDVDICLRVKLAGFEWKELANVNVAHIGHRNSHRNLRHFYWHVSSLLRLWNSEVYRVYKNLNSSK